ncbi:MAG TPA: helix-turn-helix domain-containing protein [Solirubrobacterales bacterium]
MPKRTKKPGDQNSDLAARLFFALTHPVRLRIVEALIRGPASASMISSEYGLPLSTVSYHLSQVLYEECDLVTIVRRNQRRGALEKVFALKRESYVGVISWTAIPEPLLSGMRGIALNSFLKTAIAALETESDNSSPPGLYAFHPIAVDAEGHGEISEALEGLVEKVKAVQDRCASHHPGELIQLIVGTAAFEAPPLSLEKSA